MTNKLYTKFSTGLALRSLVRSDGFAPRSSKEQGGGSVPRKRSFFSGFTLIETLVAILILSTAIGGPLTIASRGLGAALQAKNKTVALFLAQDAMEFVRYKRDTNCLPVSNAVNALPCTTGAWLAGLDACISANGSLACTVDAISDSVMSCASGVCDPLNYNTSTNAFTTASVNGSDIAPSIFTRTVSIKTPVGSNDANTEAQVLVTVSWTDINSVKSAVRQVSLQENLFNWQ